MIYFIFTQPILLRKHPYTNTPAMKRILILLLALAWFRASQFTENTVMRFT